MKLEWYWMFIGRLVVMFPLCAATSILAQWLGVFGHWNAFDYLLAPSMISVWMTYEGMREREGKR